MSLTRSQDLATAIWAGPRHHTGSPHAEDRQVDLGHDPRAGGVVRSLVDLPLLLTVSEAAEVLRISRTTAYKLIEEHRVTRGASGLPHVRLGSRIMVRRVDLAELVGQPG